MFVVCGLRGLIVSKRYLARIFIRSDSVAEQMPFGYWTSFFVFVVIPCCSVPFCASCFCFRLLTIINGETVFSFAGRLFTAVWCFVFECDFQSRCAVC